MMYSINQHENEELLAAYVHGKSLSPEVLERIEQHLLTFLDCSLLAVHLLAKDRVV
jgi:hypothetical protein